MGNSNTERAPKEQRKREPEPQSEFRQCMPATTVNERCDNHSQELRRKHKCLGHNYDSRPHVCHSSHRLPLLSMRRWHSGKAQD
jgi:hypothetical protein